MSAWGSVTFNRHSACRMNCFGFYMRSYPPKLLRLLTVVGATSRREEGEVMSNTKIALKYNDKKMLLDLMS